MQVVYTTYYSRVEGRISSMAGIPGATKTIQEFRRVTTCRNVRVCGGRRRHLKAAWWYVITPGDARRNEHDGSEERLLGKSEGY